jgi:hypothetical protein
MLRRPAFFLLLGLLLAPLGAEEVDAGLRQRAGKIVGSLQLADAALADRLTTSLAQHYAALQNVHRQWDEALRGARASAEPSAVRPAEQAARDTATARQTELHYAFFARLGAELAPAEVEAVKDGMTYGVLPLTLGVYERMFPELRPEERIQLRAWLLEAREHALTAGSSEEKHGWFGKYKGRINNYLSKAGYNLKEGEKNLKARS